ncbi:MULTISPECIES: DUF4407 domain-containing protein [unclassified Blastococcus]|uniref:DUF4407 domain-containing protein n=1 Tax=unclassified Blastococcus TaxID=2619396 RepID=UPI002815ECD7|nr:MULTISPECIES: DUF4407 domain-containing protein [unclassified Blastococcus]
MARRRERIGDGLAVLSGARADVLEAVPGARAKFVALGGVLLSTGGLAVLSMAFAVSMALGVWWPLAALVGLGWGFVIVNLDRMLLVGMAHDPSMRRNLLMAVPRVGLALVLGIVISTPLTLQIFHKEIDTQVVALQAEASDAYKRSLDDDARFAGLPALREKFVAEQAVVASGGTADADLAPLQAEVVAAQAAYDAALTAQRELSARAQCELDGTCGTGDAGTGEAYAQARRAADGQRDVVAAAKSDLDAAVAAVSAGAARSMTQAAADLETDRAELARLTEQQTALQAAFDATNADNTGILIRLQALSALSDSNTTMAIAHYMLALLFISVELLPVLMKMLLNVGPRSTYDRLSDLRDDGDLEIEQLQQSARVEVEQAVQELLVLAEKERVDRQKEQVLARRRARIAAAVAQREAAEQVPEPRTEAAPEDAGRRTWDTGPILGLARTAASRTVRTMRRRPDVRPEAGSGTLPEPREPERV